MLDTKYNHELVEKVRKATEIAKELRPDLDIDGNNIYYIIWTTTSW